MEDKEVRRVPQALIIQYIRKIKILPIDNLVAPTGVAHPYGIKRKILGAQKSVVNYCFGKALRHSIKTV